MSDPTLHEELYGRSGLEQFAPLRIIILLRGTERANFAI